MFSKTSDIQKYDLMCGMVTVWSSIHYNGNPYKWYMNPCQWIDDLGIDRGKYEKL